MEPLTPSNTQKTSQWLSRIESLQPDTRRKLERVYGNDHAIIQQRVTLLAAALRCSLKAFGNQPVRVFRSPGRINLRGMHVDTHGGFLNLMTHHREVIVVASPASEPQSTFINVNPAFAPCTSPSRDRVPCPSQATDWRSFIMQPDVRLEVQTATGRWGNYINGALLKVAHLFPGQPANGIDAVIGSDLPRGAALSSSAALCSATLLAILGWNNLSLDRNALTCAARDAEWYTGSRCGLSDQVAMILTGRNELLNIAIVGHDLKIISEKRHPWPDELKILVINSQTERSISGGALVDYTRNRFAYSLALEILRQEARTSSNLPESSVEGMNVLANLSPSTLGSSEGSRCLMKLVARIPERISIDELRTRYHLPNLDQSYHQYFGTVPEELRPTWIGLRGPLLFGIAESERARVFADALQAGDFPRMGQLMSLGHGGDRRVTSSGEPWVCSTDDVALKNAIDANVPIEMLPGAYGASSPVLDRLVDTAVEAGALGASLTGAGIAGSVLALCTKTSVGEVAEALRKELSSDSYRRLANLPEPIPVELAHEAVVENVSSAPAGELILGA